MNRRGFLKLLSAVPVGAVLAEPIARTIFLPPRSGWPTGKVIDALAYRVTERFSVGGSDWRAIYGTPDLSIESLEEMLIELRKPVKLTPDVLLVSPQNYRAAESVLRAVNSDGVSLRSTSHLDKNSWLLKTGNVKMFPGRRWFRG